MTEELMDYPDPTGTRVSNNLTIRSACGLIRVLQRNQRTIDTVLSFNLWFY